MSYRYHSLYFDDPIVPGRTLDLFEPAKTTRPLALFFIHGGGWSGGQRDNMHKLMRGFNHVGYVCGSTDYRLNGVTIEEQIADVVDGWRLFLAELAGLGQEPRAAVFGSSAGAHLTLMLGMRGAPEARLPLPEALITQSTPTRFEPWEEILPAIWAHMQHIVGVPYDERQEAYHRVAPVEHISGDTPPILLLEAGNEHMFPREFNLEFKERLRRQGCRVEMIDYPKAEHGFLYDLVRPCQKRAFADICRFLDRLG